MSPLLLKLFYLSDVGKKVRSDAHAAIDDQEAAATAKMSRATEKRDQRLAAIQAEMAWRTADHVKYEAAKIEAEKIYLDSHWQTVVYLPGQMTEAHRLHSIAMVPLRDELRALAKGRVELNQND